MLKLAIDFNAINFGIEVLYVANNDYSMYVPYKDLYAYIEDVDKYIKENQVTIVNFHGIPHCVFGSFKQNIVRSVPPDLGKFSQPLGKSKSKIRNMPTYRLTTYLDMCKKCVLSQDCDGFLVNDVNKFGTGNLKPVLDNKKEI